MHPILFQLGLHPRPGLQHSPALLAGFKGPTTNVGEGRERKWREKKVEFHHLLLSNLTTVKFYS